MRRRSPPTRSRRGVLLLVAAALLLALAPGTAVSADADPVPGTLDDEFNGKGFNQTNFKRFVAPVETRAIAAQGDDIVVAGIYEDAAGEHIALIRLLGMDGSLDTTFGTDGTARLDVAVNTVVHDIVVDSEGRIAIAGASDDRAMVARFLPHGVPDPSFGTDNTGLVSFSFDSDNDETSSRATALVVRKVNGNDQLVVAGVASMGASDARYDDVGLVHLSMSGDIAWSRVYDHPDDQEVADVAVRDFGLVDAIVVVGSSDVESTDCSDRQKDTMILITDIVGGVVDYKVEDLSDSCRADGFNAMAVMSNLELVIVTGFTESAGVPSETRVLTAVYDGPQMDRWLTAVDEDGPNASGQAVAARGEPLVIYVASSYGDSGGSSFALARYPLGGQYSWFEADIATAVDDGDILTDMFVDNAAGFLLGGYSRPHDDSEPTVLAVARMEEAGVELILDPDFAEDGAYVDNLHYRSHDQVYGITLQSDLPDEGIVTVGSVEAPWEDGGGYDVALARYTSSGLLDSESFGESGIASFDVSDGDWDVGRAVISLADGELVVVGDSTPAGQGTESSIFAAWIDKDADPDVEPVVAWDEPGAVSVGHAMALVNEETVIAGGGSGIPGARDFLVTSFHPDEDEAVSRATLDIWGDDEVRAVAVQRHDDEDKIVAGGFTQTSGGRRHFALARFRATDGPDGAWELDETFGPDDTGFVVTGIEAQSPLDSDIGGIAVLPGGEIVAGGRVSGAKGTGVALARYDADGVLDETFHGDGIVTDFITAPDSDDLGAIAVQPDGKIVVFGSSMTSATTVPRSRFLVARYNRDGTRDLTFGSESSAHYTLTSASHIGDVATAGVLYPGTGAPVLAGTSSEDFGVARFHGDPDADIPGAPSLAAGHDTGPNMSDGITRVSKPNLVGTGCVPGLTVVLLVDGAETLPSSQYLCSADGPYHLAVPISLPDGSHSLAVAARNGRGTGAASDDTEVVIDTDAGAPTIDTMLVTLSEPGQLASIHGTVDDQNPHRIEVRTGDGVPSERLCSALVEDGKWTCPAELLPGRHDIVAEHSDLAGNESDAVRRVLTIRSAARTEVMGIPASEFGVNADITVRVATMAGIAEGGQVELSMPGIQEPARRTVNAAGLATFTIPGSAEIPPGNYSVEAQYQGKAFYDPSAPVRAVWTVMPATPTLSVETRPQSRYGDTVTITATVRPPGVGTPAGRVVFDVEGNAQVEDLSDDNASASVPYTLLEPGVHDITVRYGGDPSSRFLGAGPVSVSHLVRPGVTTTTVESSAASTVTGELVTITATVEPRTPTAGAAPLEGDVEFWIDGTRRVVKKLDNGEAKYTVNSLDVSAHSVTVMYQGSAYYDTSTGTLQGGHDVVRAPTTLTLTSAPQSISLGETVTLTAFVEPVPPGAGAPTGTVTFTIGNGQAVKAPPQELNNGTAELDIDTLPAGIHTVLAVYSGDDSFEPSSQELGSLTVNAPPEPRLLPQAFPDRGHSDGRPILVDVLANDIIPPGAAPVVAVAQPPVNGIAEVIDNQIEYTPMADFEGVESFSYEVCIADDLCDRALVILTVRLLCDIVDGQARIEFDPPSPHAGSEVTLSVVVQVAAFDASCGEVIAGLTFDEEVWGTVGLDLAEGPTAAFIVPGVQAGAEQPRRIVEDAELVGSQALMVPEDAAEGEHVVRLIAGEPVQILHSVPLAVAAQVPPSTTATPTTTTEGPPPPEDPDPWIPVVVVALIGLAAIPLLVKKRAYAEPCPGEQRRWNQERAEAERLRSEADAAEQRALDAEMRAADLAAELAACESGRSGMPGGLLAIPLLGGARPAAPPETEGLYLEDNPNPYAPERDGPRGWFGLDRTEAVRGIVIHSSGLVAPTATTAGEAAQDLARSRRPVSVHAIIDDTGVVPLLADGRAARHAADADQGALGVLYLDGADRATATRHLAVWCQLKAAEHDIALRRIGAPEWAAGAGGLLDAADIEMGRAASLVDWEALVGSGSARSSLIAAVPLLAGAAAAGDDCAEIRQRHEAAQAEAADARSAATEARSRAEAAEAEAEGAKRALDDCQCRHPQIVAPVETVPQETTDEDEPSRWFLLAHQNRHGGPRSNGRSGWYYPERKSLITGIVVHTAESNSAAGVAGYLAGVSRPASAHVVVDEAGPIDLLPDHYTAFHAAKGNGTGLGIEIAYKAAKWGSDPAHEERLLRNSAAWCAVKCVQYGIPVRRLSVEEWLAGTRGFIAHAQLDPSRRSDPGPQFPWDYFFELIELYSGGGAIAPSEGRATGITAP